jgi:hypothetical protein
MSYPDTRERKLFRFDACQVRSLFITGAIPDQKTGRKLEKRGGSLAREGSLYVNSRWEI